MVLFKCVFYGVIVFLVEDLVLLMFYVNGLVGL